MTTYLDLLPLEILEHIDNINLLSYQSEHKSKMKAVFKEIDMMWIYSLWNCGYRISNFLTDKKHLLPKDEYNELIVNIKNNDSLIYIKPSFVIFVNIYGGCHK